MNANRLIAIVLGLLTAGVLALGWVIGVAPKLAEASQADGERALVEAQNAAYEALLADLADKYENIDELRAELADLQVFLPDAHQLEDFLDRIDAAAASAGVVLDVVTIGEPLEVMAGEDGATTESGPVLITIPVTVQVLGPLTGLLALADSAQHHDRVFVISGVTFDLDSATGVLTGSLFVIAEPVSAEASATEAVEE